MRCTMTRIAKKSRKLSQHSNESRRDRQSRWLAIEKLLFDAKDLR